MTNFSALLGRILLAAIFLWSAYSDITNYQGMLGAMTAVGMPAGQIGLPIAIAGKLLGGLSILVGCYTRLGAVILILFLLPATYYFHAFWKVPAEQAHMQAINFMKNLGLIGGLLMIVASGAGGLSLDRARGRKRRARSTPAA